MNDMAVAIIPKSDQVNSDDLIAGPMTIKVSGVQIRQGQEQPVSIQFEGDDGKPYKPCKSMSRVLVQVWGADANNYIGRSMTLYRDPTVKWGGMEVGGIRISHLSHIDEARTMPLTVTKGSKKHFTVRPLQVDQGVDWGAKIKEAATLDALGALWRTVPKAEKPALEKLKDARKAALIAPQAEESAPVTYAAVSDAINKAETVDDITAAEKSIALVPDSGQQVELKEMAENRKALLA